jgi:aryl-alcohol dehydrogenase-like predicted oxidoreductase
LDRAWACVETLRTIATSRHVSVARIALAWLRAQPHVTSIIIGARKPEQLQDNIDATLLDLSDEELTLLNAVSALPSEYPGWMIERQIAGRSPQPFPPIQ